MESRFRKQRTEFVTLDSIGGETENDQFDQVMKFCFL